MSQIITNFDPLNNHFKRFRDLIKNVTEVTFASPFLLHDFGELLSDLDLSHLTSFRLITTLPPKSVEQFRKADSLISLVNFLEQKFPNVNLNVRINNRLHGKIYLFRKGPQITGIITSANLTSSGLKKNHEWGVEIRDRKQLEEIENTLSTTYSHDLTVVEIRKMKEEVDKYHKTHKTEKLPEVDLDLMKLVSLKKRLTGLKGGQFWLKPIGVSERPIEEGRPFSDSTHELDFSKKRPRGVKVGHIIVAYGVGARKILSIYEVETLPRKATQQEVKVQPWKERWPWSVQGKNLTPEYGGKWWQFKLTLSHLVKGYLKKNPSKCITSVGGKTLGGLQRGNDKLNLASDFAEYIINEVEKCMNS